jgi:hypothetical protein
MSQITICFLYLAGLFLLPLLATCIVCWAKEALRLFHYAIKTRKFDDIAGFCVFMAVSLGLMAAIAQVVQDTLLK